MAASVARRIVYDADLDCIRISGETYEALTDKTGIGEELEVKTKAIGTFKTYQYRFKAEVKGQAKLVQTKPRADRRLGSTHDVSTA